MDASKMMSALRDMDELACRETVLGRLHPVSHLAVTLAFIFTVLSCGKYDISPLVPFAIYPVAVLTLGEIPVRVVLRGFLPALPFVFFIGIFNPILDKNMISAVGFHIPAGWVSLLSLIIKLAFTVSAAVLLVCVTGIGGVCSALAALRVPGVIISQFALTYRYIFVLGGETVRVVTAYRLRAPKSRGVSIRRFGSLCGGLFLRSLKRADAVYAAMKCRGFNGARPAVNPRRVSKTDIFYAALWISLFVFMRSVNIPQALGNLILAVKSS